MGDKSKLKEIAKLFLKLGTIGFGGPAAHIAMMRDEVVKKRGWLDEQHFLDLVGATNLISGPNSISQLSLLQIANTSILSATTNCYFRTLLCKCSGYNFSINMPMDLDFKNHNSPMI